LCDTLKNQDRTASRNSRVKHESAKSPLRISYQVDPKAGAASSHNNISRRSAIRPRRSRQAMVRFVVVRRRQLTGNSNSSHHTESDSADCQCATAVAAPDPSRIDHLKHKYFTARLVF
jgi:hypothetical protein